MYIINLIILIILLVNYCFLMVQLHFNAIKFISRRLRCFISYIFYAISDFYREIQPQLCISKTIKLDVVRTYIQSTNYSELYDCLERNVIHEIQVKLFHAQQYKTNIIEQKFIIS